jgi:CheY-like chemotaxis protein/HPt (histidine-containing phosphotransfer) domain-containing protein
VDDNATNRLVLQEMLKGWGMHPTMTEDGMEAVSALQKARQEGQPYSVVILDVMMPRMSGYEVAERIRQDESLGRPIVIMLSSEGKRNEDESGLYNAYLLKPARQALLLETLTGLIRSSAVSSKKPEPEKEKPLKPSDVQYCVLLAEDNPVNQTLAVRLLEKLGHMVRTVNNGMEAVLAVEEEEFDLVLMDVQMPEMDGIEATVKIRQREVQTGGHLPIIAVTAHAMKGDQERCLDAGMDGYVSKPIHANNLCEKMEKVLNACRRDNEAKPPMEQDEDMDTTAEIFDEAEALDRLDGDRDMLMELLELFEEHCDRMIANVREALGARDCDLLSKAAHTLKGTFGNISAKAAQEAAFRAETAAKDGDILAAGKAVETLLAEVDRLRTRLLNVREGSTT